MSRPPRVGDVFSTVFPIHDPAGHEQEGLRPAVVLGNLYALGVPRYDMVLIAPMTTFRGQDWALESPRLYPVITRNAGTVKLPADGVVLLDQVCSLGTERLARYIGSLTTAQLRPLQEALRDVFELRLP